MRFPHFAAALTLLAATGCAALQHPAPVPVDLGKPAPWIRTEIYIGLSKDALGGGAVNRWEWAGFEGELVRDFPDGFTLLDARGGWADPHGHLLRENSRLLIILYPQQSAPTMEPAINRACTDALRRLGQVEVMRVDTPATVAFIKRTQ